MHHYAIEYAGQDSQAPASIEVRACKERQAYSPENISQPQNHVCCLRPNFRQNTIEQGRFAGGNGRKSFKETREVCCELFSDPAPGV